MTAPAGIDAVKAAAAAAAADGASTAAAAAAAAQLARARAVTREWSEEEDARLVEAVNAFGGKNWKAIAALVGTRDFMQCNQRWRKSLRPGLTKGTWTTEEDDQLRKAILLYGCNAWRAVAATVDGRNTKQCKERWCKYLDPRINLGAWTPEEDMKLMESYERHEGRWANIAADITGRTDNMVKVRYKSLVRRTTGGSDGDSSDAEGVTSRCSGKAGDSKEGRKQPKARPANVTGKKRGAQTPSKTLQDAGNSGPTKQLRPEQQQLHQQLETHQHVHHPHQRQQHVQDLLQRQAHPYMTTVSVPHVHPVPAHQLHATSAPAHHGHHFHHQFLQAQQHHPFPAQHMAYRWEPTPQPHEVAQPAQLHRRSNLPLWMAAAGQQQLLQPLQQQHHQMQQALQAPHMHHQQHPQAYQMPLHYQPMMQQQSQPMMQQQSQPMMQQQSQPMMQQQSQPMMQQQSQPMMQQQSQPMMQQQSQPMMQQHSQPQSLQASDVAAAFVKAITVVCK